MFFADQTDVLIKNDVCDLVKYLRSDYFIIIIIF
jgi:hypothetical protein